MTKIALAKFLVYCGIIPFLVCAFLGIYQDTIFEINLKRALLQYGAVIASFIAGTHWGMFLSKKLEINLFLHSNFSALIAWISIMVSEPINHYLLIAVFIYLLIIDKKILNAGFIENWYFSIRVNASIIVVLSLLISLLSVFSILG